MTYHSKKTLGKGTVVSVPLKSTIKNAIILEETTKPSFKTSQILSISDTFYTQKQIEIASFIAQYYFTSLSEALGLFLPFRKGVKENLSQDDLNITPPKLSALQQKAYETILTKEKSLLFGVTGSGKTEIFIALMIKMLEKKKSCIFLMPEISLTPQMEKRLKVYFGNRVALWHSKITKKKKEKILEEIENGGIQIIAGARSALFVPFSNLGLIIVDEEHDDSYKSMSRPRYHARDLAVLMGDKLKAKVLLASATPSITSYYKYDVIKLSKAFKQREKKYHFITGSSINHTMLERLSFHYQRDNQSLLFLPIRGNFKYLYCESCGKTHLCPYCSVGMSLHRNFKALKCHYCNYVQQIIEVCSYCGASPLKTNRLGTVEAKEIIGEAIDGMVIEQFDKDSITTTKKLKDALSRFEKKESHLLLGTQMLSKGHDYANITLAVIMGLDFILGMSDYRAREKALSLLFQISGRSGRAKEAEVLVQTADPEFFKHYLADYEIFMKEELVFLEMAEYPPFFSLARVLIAHKNESKASKITLDTVIKLKKFQEIEIVGSGKAPLEKIANQFRFHILLRSKNRVPLLKALHSINNRDIEIDFDPIEFS